MKIVTLSALLLLTLPSLSFAAEKSQTLGGMTVLEGTLDVVKETPEQHDARMGWWRAAKFGMFIHWGVYAVPAKNEWMLRSTKTPIAEYREFSKQFTASAYDPEGWARLAKEAGMKYMVLTAKHHEGFALFPTKTSAWNVCDASPAKRDLVGPLEKAARKEGLKFGLYYSHAQDWVNPGGSIYHMAEGEVWDEAQKGDFDEYLKKVAVPQTAEILSRYKPDILWWDTPYHMNTERAKPFVDLVNRYPGLITNNRLGGGYRGDTKTPEQFVPITGYVGDWETCMTINGSWGYRATDLKFKSTTDLIHKLADVCSKGGNLLLNVGPMADGVIPQPLIDRLKEMGVWLRTNGESIYGTTKSPFRHLSWGCATRKKDLLYLHVFEWPKDRILHVPLQSGVLNARLGAKPAEKLPITKSENGLLITVPSQPLDLADTVVVLQLEGEPKISLPTAGAKVTASSSAPGNGPENAIDGTGEKRWAAAEGTKSATLELELAKKQTIVSFGFDDPDLWPHAPQKYTLEGFIEGEWTRIAQGETKGHGAIQNLTNPVTAQKFRITIENEKSAPSLDEIELYGPE